MRTCSKRRSNVGFFVDVPAAPLRAKLRTDARGAGAADPRVVALIRSQQELNRSLLEMERKLDEQLLLLHQAFRR